MSAARSPHPPAPPGDRTAFREVYLLHVPPAGTATMRQLGRYMFEALAQEVPEGSAGPPIAARLRAVAEDLRVSAHVLAALGAGRPPAGRTAEEGALVKKAGSWAREALELVRAMEGALAAAGEGR